MTLPDGGPAVPATPPEIPNRDRSRLRASLLIGLFCMLVYNANLRSISAGDTYPARYLPFAILKHHTLFLDPIAKVAAQGRSDLAFWMPHRPDGHSISLYPVALPVLISPLYLPAVGYLNLRGWSDARFDHVARVMEKLTASLLAALSASLLYLLLLRRAKASIALLLTVAYAFGTTTWVISSQALWQHGLAGLLVIGALLFLTAPCTLPRALATGLLLGLIAANRPPDVILGAALGIYALVWAGRRRAVLLSAAAALPMLLVLFYNFIAAGNAGGGYGMIGKAQFFAHPLFAGAAGLLVSPTRGLLVYSPFFVFLALAWRHVPRDRKERGLTLAMTIAVILQIALYAKADWRGGMSWGPRYMTDLLPFLIWILVPVVTALQSVGWMVFRILIGVSIVLQALGAFTYSGSYDIPIFAADIGWTKHDMRAAWDWRNAGFLTSPSHGLAPPDLAVAVRGSFDGLEVDGQAVSAVTAGQEVVATGWALAGSATPWQVAVNVDGRQPVATQTFTDRPDVRATLRENSPSGWRMTLDTSGLTPGVHHLTVMVWAFAKGEASYLAERELTVIGTATSPVPGSRREASIDRDLVEDFDKAAARLREHQQAPGYWLTSYTSEPRFHEPRPEMNTFLTALLVDLLQPVATNSGLEDTLQRARKHLTDQIEASGLVRYHGLPDGPGIGTFGCAITPDTDNTALVWRIAPGSDRARLNNALSIIDRYRTREGLYRTWLAPREAYQCLDPGSDPNPADVGIQMHLLLLLHDVNPRAGHALCSALGSVLNDDRIWVYYRKTPLVPSLRLPDLRRAGCTLSLPDARLRSDVPGQQIWVSVARLLDHTDATQDATLTRAVLRELARGNFALIRENPPLLYHNDLTATVARYYWSEDAGYALWLRLFDEYEHPGDPHLDH